MLSPELKEFFFKINSDELFFKRISKARTFAEVNDIIKNYGYPFSTDELYEVGTRYLKAKNISY